jgi:TRAP-type uncharacterized transport system substrate-binding protein
MRQRSRILIVAGAACLVAAASLLAYRWYTKPTDLTVAVGSLDGEATKMMSAIAARLAETNAPVRLHVKETPSALEAAAAFSSGETDLAVVRGDVGDLSKAQAVAVVTHAVLLLLAPPGSSIDDMAGVKRVSVGVIGSQMNQKIVQVLTSAYGLDRAGVTFKNLSPSDARRALQTKEVGLLLVVVPITEKYIAQLRGLFPQNAKVAPILIPIEIAGAIAEQERAYESFDLPKGAFRSSPPVPSDDLTTLRVAFYLVAKKQLDKDVVTDLTQALTSARRDLLGEWPLLAQFSAPDTDAGAFLPVHPGAASFYNGDQQSFLDQWGNLIFLIPMLLGGAVSVGAAAWRFLRADKSDETGDPLDRLYAIGARIRMADSEHELDEIDGEIDRLLRSQRVNAATDQDGALNVTSLNVTAHRLENMIRDRREVLAKQASRVAQAAPRQ